MAYFDFLVEPGKIPKLETKWWYTLDMVWDPTLSIWDAELPTRMNRIVHRLERTKSGYVFEFIDEPGKIYRCSYTWAFIRVSIRNCLLYSLYLVLERINSRLTCALSALRDMLDSLKC